MSSTFSNLKFELIGNGEQSGTWGTTTNTNIGTAIEQAIVGMATLEAADFTANVATLTLTNTNAAQDARALCLNIASGAVSAAGTVNVPAIEKPYIIINGSSFTVTVKVSGQTGVAVPAGKRTVVYNNGTDVGSQINWLAALEAATLTTSGTVTLNGGTANGVAFLNGSKVLTTGSALTFDGTNLATTGTATVTKDGVGFRAQTAAADFSHITLGNDNGGGVTYIESGRSGTGAFRPLAFFTNGSEQMRLNSTGLGIGTSSPGNKLHVVQAKSGSGAESYDLVRLNLSGTNALGDSSNIAWFNGTGSTKVASISGILGADNAAYGTLAFSTRRFTTDTLDEAMRIDNRGNLGLGVTPSAWDSGYRALQVGLYSALSYGEGRTNVTTNAYYNGTNWLYGASDFAALYKQGVGHQWFTAPSGTAGNAITFTQAMTLDASGNLGIGTTSPQARLHVRVGTNNNAYIDSTGGTLRFTAVNDAANDNVNLIIQAENLLFNTDGSERARIDSSGNLLVGGTSGGSGNSFAVNTNSGNGLYTQISHPNGTGSGVAYEIFYYNGSNIGSITQSGTTGVLYNIVSDYRLKTVIGPVADAGHRIDALQPVEYTWNADGSRTRGFLAHQFQEVYPSSVTGSKDAVDAEGKPVYQAMQAGGSETIADLVAEIQSLRARVLALESN
jgi:hypothetical protein